MPCSSARMVGWDVHRKLAQMPLELGLSLQARHARAACILPYLTDPRTIQRRYDPQKVGVGLLCAHAGRAFDPSPPRRQLNQAQARSCTDSKHVCHLHRASSSKAAWAWLGHAQSKRAFCQLSQRATPFAALERGGEVRWHTRLLYVAVGAACGAGAGRIAGENSNGPVACRHAARAS